MAKKKSSRTGKGKRGRARSFTGQGPSAGGTLAVAKPKVGATVQALIAGANGAKRVETFERDDQQWIVRPLG